MPLSLDLWSDSTAAAAAPFATQARVTYADVENSLRKLKEFLSTF